MTVSLQPETDQRFLAEFRVDGALAVRGLLRELVMRRGLIAIYAEHGRDDFVISQILALDEQQIDLDFVTDPARHSISEGRVVVIGLLETVKMQFTLNQVQRVPHPGGILLRAPLPDHLYRIQRRDTFRVRPRVQDQLTLSVRAPDGESRHRIIDLSVGGLAYAIELGTALPSAGDILRFSRVEAPDLAPIPCELQVRHVSAGLRSEDGAHRIGCEYHRPDSVAARALQMLVVEMERRYRHTVA